MRADDRASFAGHVAEHNGFSALAVPRARARPIGQEAGLLQPRASS